MLCAAHHSAQPAHDSPSQKSPAQSRSGQVQIVACILPNASTAAVVILRRRLRDSGVRFVTITRTPAADPLPFERARRRGRAAPAFDKRMPCSQAHASTMDVPLVRHPSPESFRRPCRCRGGNSRRGPAAGKPAATSPAHRNQRHRIPIGLHATKRHRENLIRQELPPRQEAVSVGSLVAFSSP